MALSFGTRIGSYEIEVQVGLGGLTSAPTANAVEHRPGLAGFRRCAALAGPRRSSMELAIERRRAAAQTRI